MLNVVKKIKTFLHRLFADIGNIFKSGNIRKGFRVLRRYGFKTFFIITHKKISDKSVVLGSVSGSKSENPGNALFELQQSQSAALDMPALIDDFTLKPLISIIMPLYNSPLKWLEYAIKSIQNQTYTNWELCAVDDGSSNSSAANLIRELSQSDKRIHICVLDCNIGIAGASNKALEAAQGDYIALMDHDDELTFDALFWFVKEINEHPDSDFLYSDECMTDCETNRKYDFFCKPDWSPSLLLNYMYIRHLTVYRTSTVRTLGGFRSQFNFSQDYDLALRMGDTARNIRHIERILYFWRSIPGSAASGDKDFARQSNLSALSDWYKRNNIPAVISDNGISSRNIGYPLLPADTKVSIIISSDNPAQIKKTIKTLLKKTTYKNIELVIVTNPDVAHLLAVSQKQQSNPVICEHDTQADLASKYNKGAAASSGEVLCFIAAGIMPLSKDWIERILDIMILPGVGAVSPLHLSKRNTIQNAGIIVNLPEIYKPAYYNKHYNELLFDTYGPCLIRDISVLPHTCMFVHKHVFDKVGGFDNEIISDSLISADISFRIRSHNYRCVYTPYSVVKYKELINNTPEYTDKAAGHFFDRWGQCIERDPYFTDSMKKIYDA